MAITVEPNRNQQDNGNVNFSVNQHEQEQGIEDGDDQDEDEEVENDSGSSTPSSSVPQTQILFRRSQSEYGLPQMCDLGARLRHERLHPAGPLETTTTTQPGSIARLFHRREASCACKGFAHPTPPRPPPRPILANEAVCTPTRARHPPAAPPLPKAKRAGSTPPLPTAAPDPTSASGTETSQPGPDHGSNGGWGRARKKMRSLHSWVDLLHWVQLPWFPTSIAEPCGTGPMASGVTNKLKATRVLHPRSQLHRRWDLLLTSMVMFQLILKPFQVSFLTSSFSSFSSTIPSSPHYSTPSLFWFWFWLCLDLCLDGLYLLNVFITMRTGYFELGGNYVNDPQKVRERYVKEGRFVFDLISLLPLVTDPILSISYSLFSSASTFGAASSYSTTSTAALLAMSSSSLGWRWIGLLRLLRLPHVYNFLNGGEDRTAVTSIHPNLLRFGQVCIAAFFVGHYIACGWMAIGQIEGFGSTDWVPSLESVQQRPLKSQYIQAFYWSLATMTGQSDRVPTTDLECCYTMFVVFVGLAFFATMIGNVGSLMQNIDYSAMQYREKIDMVNRFLRYRGIPAHLRKRVNDYYCYLWRRQKGIQEADILGDLSTSLRTEIALYLNKDIVSKVPFFSCCESGFISVLVTMLKPQVSSPGEYIIRQGDFGREVYFMSKGWVEVIVNGRVVTRLGDGSFFGEMALLRSERRAASVRALTYCDLFYLTKEDFNSILEEFPQFASIIRATAVTRMTELHYKDLQLPQRSNTTSVLGR